jgi:phage terminase large subunit-like protein
VTEAVDAALVATAKHLLGLAPEIRFRVLRRLNPMERGLLNEAFDYLINKPASNWYCRRSVCDGMPHPTMHWCEHPMDAGPEVHKPWCKHARTAQRPPRDYECPEPWSVWLFSGGRGTGKTRAGAEWVLDQVWNQGRMRGALVGRTPGDIREVMIEGESGIMACSAPYPKPQYFPSLRRVIWPNGAMCTTYASFSPDELRGPEHDFAWGDEVAVWKDANKGDKVDTTFSNLKLGLRKFGADTRMMLTTTPKRVKLIRELWDAKNVVRTTGTTYENITNLSGSFQSDILDAYAGSRLERQELLGQLLVDVEGALWSLDSLDSTRVAWEDDDDEAFRRTAAGLLVPA